MEYKRIALMTATPTSVLHYIAFVVQQQYYVCIQYTYTCNRAALTQIFIIFSIAHAESCVFTRAKNQTNLPMTQFSLCLIYFHLFENA